jgi:beta-lactamase class D
MQDWIDRTAYGNRDISGAVDMFWLNNTLRISALEQVDFLRRLADGRLPFSTAAQETARRITIVEDAPSWTMHAKTGWATKGASDGKTDLGWVVGWVEREGRRWFFAINIDMPDAADPSKRMPLARALLADLGAFGSVP